MASAVAYLALLMASAAQSASEDAPPEVQPVAETVDPQTIIVTGTRIITPDRTSASPVQSVRQEDFVLTGVANVEQTLNQFPQISPSFTSTSNNPGTGAATLDLRGLGSVRTLILVDGRRWIASDAGQVPEVDINTIPSALIDRVDIVTGGASAVYGSDAVTGVINFVLKRNFEGLELEARNSLTEIGDARSSSVDLTGGANFADGRGNVTLSVGYLDQAPVLASERDYTAYALDEGCVIPGTENRFGFSDVAPNPDFVCDGPNEELGFVSGGSSIIPEGRIRSPLFFPQLDGSLLRSTQTRFAPGGILVPYNPDTDRFNFAPENYIQVQLRRISANLMAHYEISEHFDPYVHASYIRTRSPSQLATAPGFLGGIASVPVFTLNLDNPFLDPATAAILETSLGVDADGDRGFIGSNATGFQPNPAFDGDADGLVTANLFTSRLTGLGPRRVENKRNAYRILVGARGKLGEHFDYDAYFSTSKVVHETPFLNSGSAARLQQAMLAVDDGSGNIVCIDPSGGCVPVNLFGQQGISPEASAFIAADVYEETRVKESIAEFSIRGPLMELPAGSLDTAFGAQWRQTSYIYEPDRSLELGDNLGFGANVGTSGKVEVVEFFGEALVPILRDRPFADQLSAELGIRYSRYNKIGGAWTWKAMANWAPVHKLRFRAGIQKATRAPNVRELYEETTTALDFVYEPCSVEIAPTASAEYLAACAANGVPNPSDSTATFGFVTTGGNPDLKPETAYTMTIGMVAQPLSGLNISLDYYDIDIDDFIGPFGGGPFFVTGGCILEGGDPNSGSCRAVTRDVDGFLDTVTVRAANLPNLRARGIDWQFSLAHRLLGGTANISLAGTRLISVKYRPLASAPAIECAGVYGFPCGFTILGNSLPKWKLYNRFSWSRGVFTFSLRHRFFTKSEIAGPQVEAALDSPITPISERARFLASRHYFDLSTTFNIARKYDLTLGINNLFDRKPSLTSQWSQSNTDPSLYDILGRRFFVAVKARFK